MPTLIGIDLGSRYIKVVEVEPALRPRLINAFVFDTPCLSPEKEGGLLRIDSEQFHSRIGRVISPRRFREARIAISLPAESINVMLVILPKMTSRELSMAAVAEAKRKMIPASHAGHIFQYQVVGERIVAKIPRYEILAVRTDRGYVERLLNLFRDNAPSLISPTCYAVLNVISKDAWPREEAAFVDFGYQSISISIAREGKLFFYRNVAFGFRDIILDISGQLGIGEEALERALRQKGIPQVPFDPKDKVAIAEEIMRQKYEASQQKGRVAEEINPLELRMRWQSAIERIIQELRRSFAYYKEQSEGRRVEHIFFLGGGSIVDGLIPTLSKEIGGQCRVLAPFRDMEPALETRQFEDIERQSPWFASSAGLALSALPKKKEAVNFLPVELKAKEVRAFRYTVVALVILFIIAALFVGWLNLLFAWRSARLSLDREEARLGKMLAAVKQAYTDQAREINLNENIKLVKAKQEQSLRLRVALRQISEILPDNVVLTQMVIQGEGVSFGPQEAGAGREQQQQEVSLFEQPFSPSGAEGKIQEVAAKKGQEGGYTLKLVARIKADYETAVQVINGFSRKFSEYDYIKDIKTDLPRLEKISPKDVVGQDEIRLTEVKDRQFSITARLQFK